MTALKRIEACFTVTFFSVLLFKNKRISVQNSESLIKPLESIVNYKCLIFSLLLIIKNRGEGD
jgi:hypothetical protein